ncbi:MAG TPA: PrsW family glutamic-type intramembrane protease [Clostridia bacterium]|nr:PrsW family glutamic-type intramembrane protease [Clostridia bacterium]
MENKSRNWFREILISHTTEQAESLFIVGTPSTTPELSEQKEKHPQPWLFARVLLIVFMLYFGFYVGLTFFQNVNFLPGLIILGAFLVPLSILVFFWEMNLPCNISLYRVIMFFMGGGLVSLLYSVILYTFTDGYTNTLVIGFVEETAKLFALLTFAARRRYPHILNGILIGAAVGAGFSAFESSGYILMTALQYGVKVMLNTIFWRAILSPGSHIAWAGLMGAAVMMVKGKGRFKFRSLFHFRFIGIYLLVILLHALWDTDFPQPFFRALPLYPIILTILSWIGIVLFLKKGIRQIVQYPLENGTNPPEEKETAQ